VSECDCKTSTMRVPWTTRCCCAVGKKKFITNVVKMKKTTDAIHSVFHLQGYCVLLRRSPVARSCDNVINPYPANVENRVSS